VACAESGCLEGHVSDVHMCGIATLRCLLKLLWRIFSMQMACFQMIVSQAPGSPAARGAAKRNVAAASP
jgi:hypothetical protein